MKKKVTPPYRTWRFWRNLFLWFWVFSLVGHLGELVWGLLRVAAGSRSWESFLTIPLFAVAMPYGLGAVALKLTLAPLMKRKPNLAIIFLASMVLMTAIEFVCAAVAVALFGRNFFWDYSDQPFNLFGWICLRNSLVFGVGATVALKWVFPWCEKLLARIKARYLDLAFWLLFPSYVLVQIVHFIKGF